MTRAGASTPRARAYSPTAKRRVRVPGQRLRALALVREVEKRRQERPRLELTARRRAAARAATSGRAPLAFERRDGERAVGGPRGRSRRRSGSCELDLGGRERRARRGRPPARAAPAGARQPRWRSTPVYGGSPFTSPTSLTASASKPAASVTRAPSSSARTGSSVAWARSALRHPSCTTRAATPTSASGNEAMSCCRKSTRRPSRCRSDRSCSAAVSSAWEATAAGSGAGRRRQGGRCGRRRGPVAHRQSARREPPVEQDAEEARPCEEQAGGERQGRQVCVRHGGAG